MKKGKHNARRLLSALLAVLLLCGNLPGLVAQAASTPRAVTASSGNLFQLTQDHQPDGPQELPGQYAPGDTVTLIVELEAEPQQTADTALEASHASVKQRIVERLGQVSVASTSTPEFGFDYYCVFNGFSLTTRYGNLEVIRSIPGVKNAFVEQTYARPELPVQPQMANSVGMIGADTANISGYTGKGTVVAVLDTGLDVNHEAFQTAMPQVQKYDRDDIAALIANGNLSARRATVRKVYVSDKIPFVYDYADADADVNPPALSGMEHGTHVAGTVAANGEHLKGVAPDAQIMMMKVFRDYDGGAATSYLLAALDDAVKLGVDAINMSLGAECGLSEDADATIRAVYQRVQDAGINLAVSAGNSTHTAFQNATGQNLPYAEDPDYGILGSPSSYEPSMSVASLINTKIDHCPYLTCEGRQIFFTDVSADADPKLWALDGEYSYVYCGFGRPEDFETAGYVKGKIALISRGENNFTDKVRNAAQAGAVAAIVMNNQSGAIGMSVEEYVIPAVSITQADGNFLRDREVRRVTLSETYFAAMENPQAYRMSNFSSWGVTPELTLKPEITAPGENIYSSVPGGNYVSMSGTSMAAPHVAGAFAAVKQYAEEAWPELTAQERYDRINSLIMSTATPATDEAGEAYSPRQQGAGLLNISDAIASNAYLSVADNRKPKAELGSSASGSYTFTVTLHNLAGEAKRYTADTLALLEEVEGSLFTLHCRNRNGDGFTVDYGGLEEDGSITVPAMGTASVTVTITLDESLRNELAETHPSGAYVEGFVRFLSEDCVDLSLPYLGFYGDWAKVPFFEPEYQSGQAYHTRPSIVYNAVQGAATYLGQNLVSTLLGGETLIHTDRYCISPNSLGNLSSVVATQTGIKRSAQALRYTVTNRQTGQLVAEWNYTDITKSFYYQSQGLFTYAEAYMYDSPTFSGLDAQGKEVPAGTYTWTVEATPYAGDGSATDSWSFDFQYDPIPAELKDYEFATVDGNRCMKLVMRDNFYLSGVQVQFDEAHAALSLAVDDSEGTDKNGDRLYSVWINLEPLYEDAEATGFTPTQVLVYPFDYAMNVPTAAVTALEDVPPQTVRLSRESMTLAPGMQVTLGATVEPAQAKDCHISWTSSDASVASVDENGLVQAKRPGTATVTVTVSRGETACSATCTVTVEENPGVSIDPQTATVTVGEQLHLQALAADGGAVSFSVSDPALASIDATGLLTAQKPGSLTVTAASIADPAKIAQASITIEPEKSDFTIDENGILTAYTGASIHVRIPDGVREIGSYVLGWSSKVKSVTIPASVEKIGNYAFSGCSSLEQVTIEGSGLTEIGMSAFSSSGLTEVTLPASVQTVGNSAFAYCASLQRVTLAPKGLKTIGDYAFTQTAVEAFEIPDTVTSIGAYAFSQSLLRQIVIPESVTTLGDNVFFYTTSLEKAILPDSITELGNSVFWKCGSLTELRLPAGLKSIGQSAIYGTSLETLDLPATLESIGDLGLASNNFAQIVLPENVKVLGNNALQGNALATEIILNDKLETIGNQAFIACSSLERVHFGKHLRNVGNDLFKACDLLREIEVSTENTSFKGEDGVLYSKDGKILYGYAIGKLDESFTVPASVEEIRPYAFNQNPELIHITLPEGLRTIGEGAFYQAQKLEEIVLPDSLTALGTKAFFQCPSLTAVTTGRCLENIPAQAFRQSRQLAKLTFSEGLKSIDSTAFEDADLVEEIRLPEGFEELRSNAFLGCDSLKYVYIPASVSRIDSSAFNFCCDMEAYEVVPGNEHYASIDGVLLTKDCATLLNYPSGRPGETYTAPKGLKTINSYAFSDLTYLTEVILPAGITTISDYAFYNAKKLQKINLPDSVAHIGSMAFGLCDLREVTFGKGLQTTGWGAFMCNYALYYADLSQVENASLDGYFFGSCPQLRTVLGGQGVTSIGYGAMDHYSNPNVTIYAPADSALLSYAKNNSLKHVAYDGLTVVPKVEKTSFRKGESLHLSWLTLGANSKASYTLRLIDQLSGQEVLAMETEETSAELPMPYASMFELTITATEAQSSYTTDPIVLTVNDDSTSNIEWKTGRYSTTAQLYDLLLEDLLPENETIGSAYLLADSSGLTASVQIAGAERFSYLDNGEFMDVVQENGMFSILLPEGRPILAVRIGYADGTEVVGMLRFDFANVVYQPEIQEEITPADGIYPIAAEIWRADWDEISPANALLGRAVAQVENGKITLYLDTQTWLQADGTEVTLLGLAAKNGQAEKTAHGFCLRLPENVSFTEIFLHYDDAAGQQELPRIARLRLDLAHVEAAPLTITRQPESVQAGHGEIVQFAVESNYGDLASYRWQYYDPANRAWVDLAQGDELRLAVSERWNGVMFRCLVKAQDTELTSHAAGLFATCASSSYLDVPENAWFHNAVDFVIGRGIMIGLGQGVFAPEKGLTRAEIVQVLYRLSGQTAGAGKTPFQDVAENAWYAEAVRWAWQAGITTGTSAETFSPNKTASREQVVTLLYRFAKGQAAEMDHLACYADAAAVSAWARDAMNWAVADGIIIGTAPATLSPAKTTTRAETAQIVTNYLAKQQNLLANHL